MTEIPAAIGVIKKKAIMAAFAPINANRHMQEHIKNTSKTALPKKAIAKELSVNRVTLQKRRKNETDCNLHYMS
jgi:hypothetical protein